ncbi:MAG: chromosome segregation protein SMC [Caldilineaceae bacterium SB0662_bin_9]|uniref:Chromosome partition protein Smc n=1 Tax=Caldilineaceae bacterium SB0662_bin_9 TaxID=2605258 RepID=A0A6B1DQI2_9CHLR|nr:chromosome segregation protein SMC [Caldilineaceae bacterium]MYD89033.1 chromosome segregation protein SMC [Caldilineaceae bacterium SB0662_bin_9]
MKLKSILLQGFKTFGRKTEIRLSTGITILVGPNGSGKSNVVDGLAWVLGEQAPTSLRIKRAADLIHRTLNGAPSRNLAEVEIRIDEATDILPTDASELTVRRTGYRDGDSEYQLNGQRVLLRQIRELLAPYGLSQRTFSLIRQGHADALLDADPLRRRQAIEEAAGVYGIKLRKQASERRLASVRARLAPVRREARDLEVSIEHLARQARTVARRNALAEQMLASLEDWYCNFVMERDRKVDALTLEVVETQQQERSLEAGLEDNNRRSRQLQDDHRSAAADLALQQRKVQDAQAAQAEVLKLDAILRERLAQLEGLRQDRERRQKELVDEVAQAGLETRRAETELTELKTVQTRQTEEVDELQTAHDRHRATQQNLHRELETVHRSLGELDRTARRHAERHLKADLDRQRLEDRLEANRKAWAEMGETGQAANEALAGERIQGDAVEMELIELRERLERAEFNELDLRNTSAAALALQQDLERRQIEARVRRQLRAEYLDARIGDFNLSQTQADSLDTIGLLGSLLDVQPAWRAAVAACLGRWAQCLVVRHWNGASQLLPPNTDGYLGVMVAAVDRVPASWPVPNRREGAGVASELVHCSNELRPVVRALLGHCWVVENFEAANRLWEELEPGQAWQIATRDGCLFRAPGMVGTTATEAEADRLLSMVHENEADREAEAQIEIRLSEARARTDQAHREVDEAARHTADMQHVLETAEAAKEHTRRRIRDLTAQLRGLQAEQEATEQESDQLRQAVDDLNQRMRTHQDSERELQGRRSKLETRLARLRTDADQADAHDTTSKLAEARQNLHETEIAVQKVAEQVRRATAAESTAQRESGRVVASLESLQVQTAQLEQEVRILADQQTDRSNLLVSETERLEQLGNATRIFLDRHRELDGERQRLHTDLNAVQTRLARLEMELDIARTKQAALPAMLADDLALVRGEAMPEADELQAQERLARCRVSVSAGTWQPREDLPQRKGLRQRILRCGTVDQDIYLAFKQQQARLDLLAEQLADLEESENRLLAIAEGIDEDLEMKTLAAFDRINQGFKAYFGRLFGGGKAWLEFAEPLPDVVPGVHLFVQLPGRPVQPTFALSGGEKALTAVALTCAILNFHQPPFCVLDEVDAPLDEANIDRVGEVLRELAVVTQFLVITHNQKMLQYADAVYGVTLAVDGTSQTLSMRMDRTERLTGAS